MSPTKASAADVAVTFNLAAGEALKEYLEGKNAPNGLLWASLRAPFPPEQTEWLPKQMRKDDQDKGRCEEGSRYCADAHPCGGWHARSIHLTYIGHAGVTDRLNDVDPLWTWEPMALTEQGTPLATDGGLWIRLTVLGVTRLGFGDAQGKSGTNAVKEIIGDAIRNAAMRFGVGTYLWSKSEAAKILAAGGDPEASERPAVEQARAAQQAAAADEAQAARPVRSLDEIEVELAAMADVVGKEPLEMVAKWEVSHGKPWAEATNAEREQWLDVLRPAVDEAARKKAQEPPL